jgi:hypothetical protein
LPEIRLAKTWKDPGWREALQKLQASAKFALEQSLVELVKALQECRSVKLDPSLQQWSPSRWDPPRDQATQGEWAEYRLGDSENRARVVICFDKEEDVIYLVARTAIHDHTALRKMVSIFNPR